ncbi:MAG TPA: response regulator transcription factor [Actinomycetes bacterium]|nr:response regulator transcription factor [Actinomycetes bacterium]
MTEETIRIVLADDQDLVREGVRMMLEAEADFRVIGEARSGIAAVQRVEELDPDVVLMDIRMPVMDGIEATTRIASTGARARVLILTTFDLDEYVFLALRAGASGFLLKDATRDQLTRGVRSVARGDALLDPGITRRLIEEYCRVPPASSAAEHARLTLSERELEVLLHVAQAKSNAEIAADLFVSEATVKSYVARLLSKLGLRDRVQIVVYAYEQGLVAPGARDDHLGK